VQPPDRSPDTADRAGELLARLLSDPQFRAEFRRDPAAACAAFELPGLADELEGGKALHTLELRESRSSLAGVMLAAAAEGVGVAEFFRHYHGGAALTSDASRAVAKAMTSPRLQAVTPSTPAPTAFPEPQAPAAAPAPTPVDAPEPTPVAAVTPAAQAEHVADPVVPDAHVQAPPVEAPPPEPDILANPRLVMDGATHAALEASAGDPAVAGVLAALTREHGVTLAVSSSDTGPAFDVVAVDGKPIDAANVAARDIAAALAELDPGARPIQVVTPWPIDSDGFVTDAAHPERLHLVFSATPSPGARGTAVFGAAGDAPPRQTLGAVPAAGTEPHDHQPAEPPDQPRTGGESLDLDGPNPYPGDDAPKAQIALWMAREAHKAGLPGELPVMAALTESNLFNNPGGDADSAGYFQMRESIWNTGEYADYFHKPELQLKWFIDHAVAIRDKRIAEGDPGFGHDSAGWGNWIADVEQPYEPLRERYQLHLEEARELLKSGLPSEAEAAPNDLVEPDADTTAAGAVTVAMRYRGVPYVWGGTTPAGFDCSGLVQFAYDQEGVHLPRVAADQFNVGEHIARSELLPGDLVFFQDSTGYIHHVGMYIGGDRFVHAPHTGDVVKVSSLDSPYYAHQFAGGRRYIAPLEPADPNPVEAPAPATPAQPRSTVQFLPAVTDDELQSP
jgi:hypothetical protein